MITISNTHIMNSSALDLGLISKDTNVGSIDTDSLFNCFGAAITCDNDNTVNNNVAINNGTNPSQEPIDPAACALCLEASLSDLQISLLGQLIGLQANASLEAICLALEGETAATLTEALQNPVINLSDAEVTVLIDCLIEAGFTNLNA